MQYCQRLQSLLELKAHVIEDNSLLLPQQTQLHFL